MVAFAFLYFRYLYTIRPDAVYRKALILLNTNPGILEVRPIARDCGRRRSGRLHGVAPFAPL